MALPPNKRLKLAGAFVLKEAVVSCPGGHGLSSTTLARAASRPQLKREPLGRRKGTQMIASRYHRPPMMAVCLSLGILVAVWACLPIPHTERLSPRLIGRYQRGDGTPLAGVQLAVATDGDSLCSSASARTTTDSSGTFELPATHAHRTFVMLLGDWVHGYWVCASHGAGWQRIYVWWELNRLPPPTDSLLCTELVRPRDHTFCGISGLGS